MVCPELAFGAQLPQKEWSRYRTLTMRGSASNGASQPTTLKPELLSDVSSASSTVTSVSSAARQRGENRGAMVGGDPDFPCRLPA